MKFTSAEEMEAENLRTCQGTNVIGFIENFKMGDVGVKVTDLALADLEALLQQYGPWSEEDARALFKQILAGISTIHSRFMIHRDLKLGNIFMSHEGKISIADLGSACPQSRNLTTRTCMYSLLLASATITLIFDCEGTYLYAAPELLPRSTDAYGARVDLWSTGVCVYRILTNEYPFMGASENALFHHIRTGYFHKGASFLNSRPPPSCVVDGTL